MSDMYRVHFTCDSNDCIKRKFRAMSSRVPVTRDARVAVRSGRRISGRIRRGMSVTGPHLSRRRHSVSCLCSGLSPSRFVFEPSRKRTLVADYSLLFSLCSSFPLQHSFSQHSILNISTAYMNSMSRTNTRHFPTLLRDSSPLL